MVGLTFFVSMDAADVALEVFTPGEALPAIGDYADERSPRFVGAVWDDEVWDSRYTSSPTFLGQIGNWGRDGLSATTLRTSRYYDCQRNLRLVGELGRGVSRRWGRHGYRF